MSEEGYSQPASLLYQVGEVNSSGHSHPPSPVIRVLYVDDDPEITLIFKTFLEKTGAFKVDTAGSGVDVMRSLSNGTFDVIVSDYHMPGLDGIGLLKEIRRLSPSLPFILFTGKGREEVVMEAINHGATFYLQKGGDPKTLFVELAHKIREAVGRQRAESALRESEEKYRTLVEHIQDGVFIIQEGKLLFINPAFASLLGYSVQELTGIKMIEIIAPEDREMVRERHKKRLLGESVPEKYEFRMLHRDGQTQLLVNMDVGLTMFLGKQAVIGTIRDITGQRKAEEAVHESERRLADVIDFLPDATVVIDHQGTVIAWNRAMEQLTGFAAGDILGKGDYAYAVPFYGSRRPILADLALKTDENTESQYVSMNRTGETVFGEIYVPNLGGNAKFLLGAASPLRNSRGDIVGAIESIRDITERKGIENELVRAREELEHRVAERTAELTSVNAALLTEIEERRLAETALRESEERYRRLVELSPDAIFVHDGTRILFVNPAGIRLLGASDAQEIVGIGVYEIVHPDFLGRVHTRVDMQDTEGSSTPTSEEKFIRLDSTVVDVEVSSAPIVYQGNPAILVVVRDITGRKKAEEQLRQYTDKMSEKNNELDFLANQLLDMNQDLDRRVKERTEQVIRLMKQKDEFITQIGHDLKTPLTPLRALLPSLIAEEQNPEIREALRVLVRSVHSIQEQTEKILTIAKLSRDDVKVQPEPVLILPIINESIQKNWLFVQRKNLTVKVEIPEELSLLFSPSDASTVFDNLIGNAAKYSSEGGHITIKSFSAGDKICIRVDDDGIGLSAEEKEHVFDDFYMADNSRHDRSSSGLGLAIVRRVIRLYKGSVRVESEGKGRGASFFVCL